MPRHDLLEEAVLRVELHDGSHTVLSLPEVLAGLGTGTVAEFSGLVAHQQHPWHAFLVQLAALALRDGGLDTPKGLDSTDWRRLLLDLSAGVAEAWFLVVPDLAKPAFMQPPVPEGSLEKFGEPLRQPDLLDLPVTAKSHDVKRGRAVDAHLDAWVYVLVAAQTSEGYSGRGWYGIARMNGGFSSRTGVGISPGLSISDRWRRDVRVLAEAHGEVCGSLGYPRTGGLGLAWVEPWDGASSLPLYECDPWVVEVARRVRLVEDEGAISARTRSTAAPRLAAEDSKGNTGDPWAVLDRARATALTLGGGGFTYKKTQDILFGPDWAPGVAGDSEQDLPQDPVYVLQSLVRGQGATDGYHERLLPVPRRVVGLLKSASTRASLGAVTARRVEMATLVRNKILSPAICALLQGGADKLKFDDDRATPQKLRLDSMIDACFFEDLWQDLEKPAEEQDRSWARKLHALAREVLEASFGSLPIPVARRYRALAAAERLFAAGMRKHLGPLLDPPSSDGATPQQEETTP